jgi:hypothetical protein
VLCVSVDVPVAFLQQQSDEMSDVDEQPQSGSDTEDEIKRLTLHVISDFLDHLATCQLNSIQWQQLY